MIQQQVNRVAVLDEFLRHLLQSVVLKIIHHRQISINGDSRRLIWETDGT